MTSSYIFHSCGEVGPHSVLSTGSIYNLYAFPHPMAGAFIKLQPTTTGDFRGIVEILIKFVSGNWLVEYP